MSAAVAAIRSGLRGLGGGGTAQRKRKAQPIEHQLMLTATMCLVAFGVVMVFSASSTASLLGDSGDSAYYLKRTLMFGAIGLIALRLLSTHGLLAIRRFTPTLLFICFGLLLAVLVMGNSVNGARSWIVAGPVQVQPSEIMKVALILYGAHLIADRPKLTADLRSMAPYLLVCAGAFALIMVQPDFGTVMVTAFSVCALLIAAGAKLRHLAILAGVLACFGLIAVLLEPYRAARITSFLSPGADASGAGFQGAQAAIAMGSGGLFGTGLGESVQKAFYLPEAHTDMIAAVIGEEAGLFGIGILNGLYMLFAYAGFRIAQRARDRYGRLLAAGLTAMILIQATINLYAVMGLAPLTGVTLPFVSYGNSSLIVTLASVGLLLNVAAGGTASSAARSPSSRAAASAKRQKRPLRVVDGGARSSPARKRPAASTRRPAASGGTRAARSDRSRRDSRARGAGDRRRRRA
jgi:cell division protein FtsW